MMLGSTASCCTEDNPGPVRYSQSVIWFRISPNHIHANNALNHAQAQAADSLFKAVSMHQQCLYLAERRETWKTSSNLLEKVCKMV